MLTADSGGELSVPTGDPHALLSAAGRLRHASEAARQATTQLDRGMHNAMAAWQSAAANSFGQTGQRVLSGCDGVSPAGAAAARLIEAYAHALAEAQQQVRRAIQQLEAASGELARELDVASRREAQASQYDATLAAQEMATAASHARRAQDDFSHAQSTALRLHDLAINDLATASSTLASGLHTVADDVARMTKHDLVDVLGAPNTLLELDTLGFATAGTRKALQVYQSLRNADFTALERLSSEGVEQVTAVAARYGEDSPEALRAWYAWQQGTFGSAARELGKTIGGTGALAKGPLRGLDVLSRVALPLGVLADGLTIADSESSGLDRGLSAANLGGIAFAASGTELGASALGLVGIESVAAFIPVVGEVVLGATAAYLAGEWAYAHRHEIAEAGRAVVDGLVEANAWVAQQEAAIASAGYDLATSAVGGLIDADAAALDAASSAVHAGASAVEHVTSDALGAAADAAHSVEHKTGKVLSSLNPLK